MRFQTEYKLNYPVLLLGCLGVSIAVQFVSVAYWSNSYDSDDRWLTLIIASIPNITLILHYRFPTRRGAIVLQVFTVLFGLFSLAQGAMGYLFVSNSAHIQLLIQIIAMTLGVLLFHVLLFHALRVTRVI